MDVVGFGVPADADGLAEDKVLSHCEHLVHSGCVREAAEAEAS